MPLTLQLKRPVPAEPARVWRAWTDPGELARWYWPPSMAPRCDVDARAGGWFRIASAAAGGPAVSGEFAAVEPPARLVHTWRWDGEEAETLVTVDFLPGASGGTDVVVTHEGFADPGASATHAQGWHDCLARLAGYDFTAG